MSGGEAAREEADAILREAARPQRLWPLAAGVLCLYLASSLWRFVRPFGDTGKEAVLHATPTAWVPVLILAVLLGAHLLGRAEVRAGGSPWRWPRAARRTLIALAVALPVLSFAVVPVVAVLTVDAGRTEVGPPLSLVTAVGIEVH